jgi:hypothetical protein
MLCHLEESSSALKIPESGRPVRSVVQAQVKGSTVTKLYKWPYTGRESLKALVRSKSIPVHLLPSCGKFRAKITSWDREWHCSDLRPRVPYGSWVVCGSDGVVSVVWGEIVRRQCVCLHLRFPLSLPLPRRRKWVILLCGRCVLPK